MTLVDSISIQCTPDKVFDSLIFYFQNTSNYKLWHRDHISCQWKKGKDFSPESLLITEEYIHGSKHKLKFKILYIETNRIIKYKFLFPFSLIFSEGFFMITPKDNETEFIAGLNVRVGFLMKIMFKKKIGVLKCHMKEEGLNLKEHIENVNYI